MKSWTFPLTALVVLAVTGTAGWMIGTWRNAPGPTPPPATGDRGAVVYQVYCASCHGPDGHGDGPSALALRPPPRDFAARPWRLEPTESAIRRVLTEGIPGTGMASFRTLPEADLQAVVAHVQRLAVTGSPGERAVSPDERLLTAAGLTGLRGTTPPPLSLTNSHGKPVRLKDHAGRLVLLHFWGTGCTHCIKEIPALAALERRYPGRLVVLHVCTDEEDGQVAQQVLDRAIPGTVALVDGDGLGLARYEVQTLPTVWLITPDGTALARGAGARDWTDPALLRVIERWLPDAKP